MEKDYLGIWISNEPQLKFYKFKRTYPEYSFAVGTQSQINYFINKLKGTKLLDVVPLGEGLLYNPLMIGDLFKEKNIKFKKFNYSPTAPFKTKIFNDVYLFSINSSVVSQGFITETITDFYDQFKLEE